MPRHQAFLCSFPGAVWVQPEALRAQSGFCATHSHLLGYVPGLSSSSVLLGSERGTPSSVFDAGCWQQCADVADEAFDKIAPTHRTRGMDLSKAADEYLNWTMLKTIETLSQEDRITLPPLETSRLCDNLDCPMSAAGDG